MVTLHIGHFLWGDLKLRNKKLYYNAGTFLSTSLKLRAALGQENVWYNLKTLDKLDRILCVSDSLTHHFKNMELKVAQYQRYSSSLQLEVRRKTSYCHKREQVRIEVTVVCSKF